MLLVAVFALPAAVCLVRMEVLRVADGPASVGLNAITGLCALFSLHLLMRFLRDAVVFAPDAVIRQGAWRARRLPRSDIVGARIRHVAAQGAHAVELRTASAGHLTLWLADDEIRTPAVATWLASLPGVAAAGIDPPPAPRPPLSGATRALLVALAVVPPLVVAATALMFFVDGWQRAQQRLPTVDQLHRTDGVLERANGCRQSRYGPPFVVDIATASGHVSPGLQCRYAGVWLQFRVGHRITILSDDTYDRFGEIWAVAIDDQPLVTYADQRAWRLDRRWSTLAFQWLLALAALTFVGTLLPAFKSREPRSAGA